MILLCSPPPPFLFSFHTCFSGSKYILPPPLCITPLNPNNNNNNNKNKKQEGFLTRKQVHLIYLAHNSTT